METNKEQIDLLIKKYSKLINSISVKYAVFSRQNDDFDDIKQISILAFIRACETYSEDKNVTLGLYAKICMKNACISYLRSQKSNKKVKYIPEETQSPEKDLILDGTDCLSKLEKTAILLRLEGQTYCQIAKTLNISEKSVSNALCRAKSKLRQYYTKENDSERN